MENVLYVVIPCYNEEAVLPETASRLLEKMHSLMRQDRIDEKSRIIFVNDGSKDKTWEIIRELHGKDKLFGGINLSRNRGHQNAACRADDGEGMRRYGDLHGCGFAG